MRLKYSGSATIPLGMILGGDHVPNVVDFVCSGAEEECSMS